MSLTGTLGRDTERIEVGGRVYTLTQPRLRAVLAAEREVRRFLGSPLRRAAELARSVPAEHAQAYWSAAYAEEARWADMDMDALLSRMTADQRVAAIALSLLHECHGQEIQTLDQAIAWCERANPDELHRAIQTLVPPPPSSKERPTSPPTGQA